MAGGDSFDLTGLGRAAADRPDVHDLLTFLTGDFRPVIRVSRIRQIFVLFELFPNRPDQIFGAEAATLLCDCALHRIFLRARNDAFDQRAAGEILKLQDFFLTIRVGDFDKSIFFGSGVHGSNG